MKEEKKELLLTPEVVQAMIVGGNYKNKDICIALSDSLKKHAYGIIPTSLIVERRPNESKSIKEYRNKIYSPITKRPISKVISSLEKIRRSQDWSVQYKPNSTPASVAEAETLEKYCESNYPHFSSLTNWAFSVLLRKYLLDANGIVAIIPEEIPTMNTDYCKPVAKFFDSEQIVDYVEGEYVVLKSYDTTTYTTHKGKRINTNGAIYHIITKNQYVRYEQISKDSVEETAVYDHNIGALPAFRVGGIFYARQNNDDIFESRIAGMVPSLNEAVREYSDLQAEILQHIHSEKYMYANMDCPVCNGTGREYVKDEEGNETGEQKVCHHCNGRGSVINVSPYGEFVISPTKFGENAIPAPPIGYVQKSTDIAKFEDEHVRQHIYDALAAVNMEFLAETPISQSGVAKAFDRDELNNFVNAVAEDIVHVLDRVYHFINEYRYSIVVPDANKRRDMLPSINVPTKYDILNTSALMAELKAAREANVNPMILRELEVDYAKKQFNTAPEIARVVEITFDLDPLFGMSEDNKMTMKAEGGITELDYIISCNIATFVRRAIRETQNFYSLEYDKQMDILKKYAEEVRKENEPANTPILNGVGKIENEDE